MSSGSLLTVLEPALTHDLTTLETVKDELSITGNEADVRLTRWIRETSGFIANWCNRTFGAETVSELWRASDRWNLHWHMGLFGGRQSEAAPVPLTLRRYPIVRMDSIVEYSGAALPPTSYEYEAATGVLWRLSGDTTDSGAACGTRTHWYATEILVTYTAGYDVPRSQPYQLEQACLMLMKNRQDGLSRDRMLRSQIVPGVLEEQFWNPATPGQPGMPPEVAEVLTPFRNYNA